MYGFYVDHVLDVAGAVLLFGGLGLSPYMTLEVALALTVAYLMISAEAYLATHARGVFRMAMFRMGPTELRILLAFGTLYLYYKPRVVLAGSEYLLFDVGGVVAAAGMCGAFAFSAGRNTLALYRAEPLPRAAPGSAAPGGAATGRRGAGGRGAGRRGAGGRGAGRRGAGGRGASQGSRSALLQRREIGQPLLAVRAEPQLVPGADHGGGRDEPGPKGPAPRYSGAGR